MQIELIDTFLDLLETKSFNKTAERLNVTQSTVSSRVAALEKHVGRKLLKRSRAGTDLTTAGLQFEPHARSLRLAWSETLRAVTDSENFAVSTRVGLQTDLAAVDVGLWMAEFREMLPGSAFYLELDYSVQMCADLLRGDLDIAVMYSPQYNPDLYFETVGEVRYVMVSTTATKLAEIKVENYIRANFSRVFDREHQARLPHLSDAPMASGQNSAVIGLLRSMGGSGYVLEHTADILMQDAGFSLVKDAPKIAQTVYAAVHIRNRTSSVSRRLMQIVKNHFPDGVVKKP